MLRKFSLATLCSIDNTFYLCKMKRISAVSKLNNFQFFLVIKKMNALKAMRHYGTRSYTFDIKFKSKKMKSKRDCRDYRDEYNVTLKSFSQKL